MSAKTNADVSIGGKVYTLSGYESEVYLQQVASYINDKLSEFEKAENYRRIPPDMKAILLHLNIADDYFKAKDRGDMLASDLEERNQEIYNLKHDLVAARMKKKELEKTIKELSIENKEMLLIKTKLETSLEDVLLGGMEKKEKAEVSANGGQRGKSRFSVHPAAGQPKTEQSK
ncbi:hypothetical protein FACS1894111_10930 [Clostridia bacterium]|nr:hypothetical protein FACS1894111_10930 [Clostridia bacterium]